MTQAIATTEVWVSVTRAANILEKTPRQIRRYAESGELRSRRAGELGWLQVSYDDVLKLKFPKK